MTRTQALPKLQDDAAYVAAVRKLEELKLRAGQLEHEMDSPDPARGGDELDRRARLVLDGAAAAAFEQPAASNASVLYQELRAVRRAIELQKEIVTREHGRASREACARVAGLHADLVARIGAALQGLGAAVAQEKALREHMVCEGFTFTGYLHPMPFPQGDLSEEYSAASRWLREAAEHGL